MNITDADLLLVARAMSAAEEKDTDGLDVREHEYLGRYDVSVRYFQRAIVEYGVGATSDEARADLLSRMRARLFAAVPNTRDLIEAELASRVQS